MNTAISVEKFNQRTVSMAASMALSILIGALAALIYAAFFQAHEDLHNAVAVGCVAFNGISYFALKCAGEAGKAMANNNFARIGALVNIALVIVIYAILGDAGVAVYTLISMVGGTLLLLIRAFKRNDELAALAEEAMLELVSPRK